MRLAVYVLALVQVTALFVGLAFNENGQFSNHPVWGETVTGKVYAIYHSGNYYSYMMTESDCQATALNPCGAYQVTTLGPCGELSIGGIMRFQYSTTTNPSTGTQDGRTLQPAGCNVVPSN